MYRYFYAQGFLVVKYLKEAKRIVYADILGAQLYLILNNAGNVSYSSTSSLHFPILKGAGEK